MNEPLQMASIGATVPELSFEAYHDGAIKTLSLSQYRGTWLVLFFYPADFTFICPTELQELAGLYPQFTRAQCEIISVSTDTAFVHKAWHDYSPAVRSVTFPMAADPTGTLCRTFGTYIEREGLSLRGTFLIDPDGVLKTIEIHDNSVGRSGKELLRKLLAAQYVATHKGEVCPAAWEPGKETLRPDVDLIGKI